MTSSFLRILSILAAVLALSSAGSARAETVQVGALAGAAVVPGTTPLTKEHVLTSLARDLAAHFNLEGDLQLELLRAWAPPARVASLWEINILEYPSVASSSMLVRCRMLANGAAVADATFMVRASLWRDAWVLSLIHI